MAQPFSTTDVYYTKADCTNYPSSNCSNQDIFDVSNCECKYKENVNKIIAMQVIFFMYHLIFYINY